MSILTDNQRTHHTSSLSISRTDPIDVQIMTFTFVAQQALWIIF